MLDRPHRRLEHGDPDRTGRSARARCPFHIRRGVLGRPLRRQSPL